MWTSLEKDRPWSQGQNSRLYAEWDRKPLESSEQGNIMISFRFWKEHLHGEQIARAEDWKKGDQVEGFCSCLGKKNCNLD